MGSNRRFVYVEASETEDIDVFVLYAVDPPQFQVADMLNVGRPKDLARAKTFVDEKMIDLEALHTLLRRFEIEEKWQKLKQL